MSRAVKQPVGQKRLTNIAVVRYKTHGIRFEIACYKNKVFDWRSGSEQDLDEVLQTETVFSNVSKGVVAKDKELKKAFGKGTSTLEICKEILTKGELQVSDRERALQLDSRLRDVASIIVEKCVDSKTKRPFPHALIERALKDPKIRFIPDNRKSAKQQMLEVVPKLQKFRVLDIERARMRVQLTVTTEEMKTRVLNQLQQEPLAETCQVERERTEEDGTYTCVMKIDPGAFRTIDSLVRGHDSPQANLLHGEGRLEVLDLAVHNDSPAKTVTSDGVARAKQQSSSDLGVEAFTQKMQQTTTATGIIRISDEDDSMTILSHAPGLQAVSTSGSVDKSNAEEQQKQPQRATKKKTKKSEASEPKLFKCNTCLVTFEQSKLHREHFKTDWHRINLKRKSQKQPIVSEEECVAILMLESAEASDLLDYC